MKVNVKVQRIRNLNRNSLTNARLDNWNKYQSPVQSRASRPATQLISIKLLQITIEIQGSAPTEEQVETHYGLCRR